MLFTHVKKNVDKYKQKNKYLPKKSLRNIQYIIWIYIQKCFIKKHFRYNIFLLSKLLYRYYFFLSNLQIYFKYNHYKIYISLEFVLYFRIKISDTGKKKKLWIRAVQINIICLHLQLQRNEKCKSHKKCVCGLENSIFYRNP